MTTKAHVPIILGRTHTLPSHPVVPLGSDYPRKIRTRSPKALLVRKGQQKALEWLGERRNIAWAKRL